MMRTKMFPLVVLASAFFAGLAFVSMTNTATASPDTGDLCYATGSKASGSSSPGGCVYSSTSVPVLAADVCWDGQTARLKGTAPCPGKQRTYYTKFGELASPLSLEVIAYAPLPSACNVVECEESDISSEGLPDEAACCDEEGGCTLNLANCEGEILWCKEVEAGENGQVICHE